MTARPDDCYLTSPKQFTERQMRRRRMVRIMSATVAIGLVGAGVWEMRESRLQAFVFSRVVAPAEWQVRPGPADALVLPEAGPYPVRLGYARLDALLARLKAKGFEVTAQARQSSRFRAIVEAGFNPIYAEKAQAGLTLHDRRQRPLHASRYPQRQFERFEDIPDLLVGALLFIENRDLLDPASPSRNPAIDWGRFARAALEQGQRKLHLGGARAGGSTLATQIEKFRYSPGGRTQDADDKLKQMISATLRAYMHGTDTLAGRQRIVLDYLNSVPLGGVPGFGEVNGLGDGLWAWFGADFSSVRRALADPAAPVAVRARAFRQALTLLVAQRRPSGMLSDRQGGETLDRLTDSHLRLLAAEGLISRELRDAALAVSVPPRNAAPVEREMSFIDRKAVNDVRGDLGELLGMRDLYQLDRLDLAVDTSFDAEVQAAVTRYLSRLGDKDFIRCAGLTGARMLDRGDPRAVNYSFTLHEALPDGNRLRVQADNLDQPLDINAGTKLDLGSSAKLRTLVSYLNVIADLHRRYAPLDNVALAMLPAMPKKSLSAWAIEYLRDGQDRRLDAMLAAAMERRYPADPKEIFFTGGGVHKFSNFKREDDRTNPTVLEALEQSVNLSFVRIMRDVAHYHAYEAADAPARGLLEGDEAVRRSFLERYAEREGLGPLRTFWHKYHDAPSDERFDLFADRVPSRRSTQGAAFLAVHPEASFDDFTTYLRERLGAAAGRESDQRAQFDQHRKQRYSLSDQAYLARVHPLELWMVRHLVAHPESTLREAVAASVEARREAGRWLLAPRHRHAQDQRIGIIVEVAAFERIAEEWKRLGYPFDQLVPSLATSIGSSADRPAALAELMGILVNDGIRRPAISIEGLRFASETPYETVLSRRPLPSQRVLPEAVARTVRAALRQVVEQGTARRVAGTFKRADGKPVAVGGKTGTGDHRSKVTGSDGNVVSSRVMNRAATFAFYIGDRHFGVVTAFVPGRKAAAYDFTSSLPVAILKELEPALRPLVNGDPAAVGKCEGAVRQAGKQGG
jgi:membrane peptidoglycan carboxypeptidase